LSASLRILVDGREVSDLVTKEGCSAGRFSEDGDDLGHEGADVLVVFIVELCDEVLDFSTMKMRWERRKEVCTGPS